jgi:Tol biopolymer transport system component
LKKQQIALLVLLSVAAAITVACGNSSNPVFSNMGLWSSRNQSTGGSPLFTMSVSGSNLTPVSTGSTDIWGISVTADFKTVVFSSNGEVWTTSPTGTTPTQLTQNAANNSSTFNSRISPNGQKIVYEVYSNSTNMESIWGMNADGSGSANLTPTLPTGMEDCYAPSFSADSTQIVFACYGGSTNGLYTMKNDGTQLATVLTQSSDLDSPFFTPNSKQILFTTFGTPGTDAHKVNRTSFSVKNQHAHPNGIPVAPSNSGIASVNIDGSSPALLLPATNYILESEILNSNLYYTVFDSTNNLWQIYKANTDGSGSASISDGTADDELGVCGDC